MAKDLIQYVNLKELTPVELDILNNLCIEYQAKLKRIVDNNVGLKVHVKCHSKEGSKKKYDVHLQVDTPMRVKLVSTKASDWDFPRTVHKAFRDVLAQAEHVLHRMEQHKSMKVQGHAGATRCKTYRRPSRSY